MHNLIVECDKDNDGRIDLDEFSELLEKSAELRNKILQALIPSPEEYLNFFGALPKGFRESEINKYETSKMYSKFPENGVYPIANNSGLYFNDITFDMVANTPIPTNTDSLNIRVVINSAKNIPLPSNNCNILNRKVYVALLDDVGPDTLDSDGKPKKKQYISNIIKVRAAWNQKKPDEWKFESKKQG